MRRAVVTLAVLAAISPAVRAGVPALADPPGPAVIRDEMAGMHALTAVGEQQQDTALEPSIAVNPADPLNAVIGYQEGRIDAHCAQSVGYATTFDGGETWTHATVPHLTVADGGPAAVASDPVVAFGPDDTVYFNALTCSPHELAVSVSHDGGATWDDPIFVPSEQDFDDDKNWMIVDNGTGPGHHPGRIYLMADDGLKIYALYSDDQARTWNGPYVLYPAPGIGVQPNVMPNGDLTVVFNTGIFIGPIPSDADPEVTFLGSAMAITTAKGAGSVPTGAPLVFTPPVSVGKDRSTQTPGHRAGDGLPSAVVDPASGRIYVAWQDARFREDGLNDIVVTWSDDAGLTWTTPRPVDPGPRDDQMEHFTPAIGVGPEGDVHIAYRTQRQGGTVVNTAYQRSTDGGRTWSDPVPINVGLIPEYLAQDPPQEVTVDTDVRFAAFSRGGAFLGDYGQVAVAGSWVYVVRCEAYRLSPDEPATFPPQVHHQRAWVAVVDTDGDGRV